MGWIFRRSTDRTNPTLPGGVYGLFITAGSGVYWRWDGSRVRFVLFISDGGRYGLDSIERLTYKGADVAGADFRFHRGTITKQITPFQISAVDAATDTFALNAHPFANDDAVRVRARTGGLLPTGANADTKYYIFNRTANTFQLSLTPSGQNPAAIDLTSAGTGVLMIWKADAGFDDAQQGLPEFVPEVRTTFSGIAYLEGLIPAQYNTNEEPDWQDFRAEGTGRRLMDYDANGNETGVVTNNSPLLRNPALADADVLITEFNRPLSRIDWASWWTFRNSAPELVWQRADVSQSGTGWLARYFNYSGSGVPDTSNPGVPAFSKREQVIDLSWAVGQSSQNIVDKFFAIYEAQVKPKYSELYTLTVVRDNGARLRVNNVLLIDQWTIDTGTATATVNLTADVPVKVKLEFFDGGRPAQIQLKWASASQPNEIIPMQAAFDADVEIPRYEYNAAAAAPTEAAEVHERILGRCPGWDWTDINGKIVYLSPQREIAFTFLFDAEDPDARTTFLDRSFEKKRRHRRDRRNFALYSFRNRLYAGYPEGFVEENRPRLRELGNGMPNNDAPSDLMVMFEGQARRIASADFKLSTDAAYTLSLSANKAAGVVTKNAYVRVRNWVKGDKRIEDAICLATNVSRQGNKLDFNLLPIPYPFYTDEPVTSGGK